MTSAQKQVVVVVAFLVVALLMFAAFWRQRSDVKQLEREYEHLAERNRALETLLRQSTGSGNAVTPGSSQDQGSGTPAAPRMAQGDGATPEAPGIPAAKSWEEPNQLALSSVSARQQDDRITATMVFKPTTTNAFGDVWVVVRLPRNSGVDVVDIAPGDSTQYTNVGKRVGEGGKFAIFQGRPMTVNSMKFDVSVSGPVTADIRGTCGIGRFNLEISPAGAKVRGN
jgi:hypothetical protein